MGEGRVMVRNYSLHVIIKHILIAGAVRTNDNDSGYTYCHVTTSLTCELALMSVRKTISGGIDIPRRQAATEHYYCSPR